MVDITRVRRESLRWSLLVALNKTRPYTASETLLLDVSRAIYPDTTPLELRRELDYLADRKMVELEKKPSGDWFADLTRLGVDLVEYTVECGPVLPARKSTGVNNGQTQHNRKAAGRRAPLA